MRERRVFAIVTLPQNSRGWCQKVGYSRRWYGKLRSRHVSRAAERCASRGGSVRKLTSRVGRKVWRHLSQNAVDVADGRQGAKLATRAVSRQFRLEEHELVGPQRHGQPAGNRIARRVPVRRKPRSREARFGVAHPRSRAKDRRAVFAHALATRADRPRPTESREATRASGER